MLLQLPHYSLDTYQVGAGIEAGIGESEASSAGFPVDEADGKVAGGPVDNAGDPDLAGHADYLCKETFG